MGEIAILMAAGLGTRMMPLTRAKPKPLISVQGTPMIETVIQGLLSRPVDKIYIVTGYLGEQFEYLREKYPQTELLVNREYNLKNNISSLYVAADCMGYENCFICEADLWVREKAAFQDAFSNSCYYGKLFSGHSDDWIFELTDGKITRIKKGGKDTYQMVGVSYWLKEDAALVRDAILEAYQHPGHENLFWDEIVDQNLQYLNLKIRRTEPGEIVEIDTVEELKAAEILWGRKEE